MSFNTSLSSDMARDKLHAAQLKQKQAESKNAELQVRQAPTSTGLQWVAIEQQAKPQTSQKTNNQNINSETSKKFELAAPNFEDLAVLSTSVSMNEESVEALNNSTFFSFMRKGVNIGALEDSFREIFKKSKSHNLLLERFMANVKLGGISMMMSFCGVPAETLEKIKKEVREKALKEIDVKLSQDWAYAKAMLEIMG